MSDSPLLPPLSVLANAKAQLQLRRKPGAEVVKELGAGLRNPRRLIALGWLMKAQRAQGITATGLKDTRTEALGRAIEAAPNYFRPHSYLGYRQLLQGAFEDARLTFERALQLKPDDVGARMGAVKACRAAGDDDAALDHLRTALWADEGPRLVQAAPLWGQLIAIAESRHDGVQLLDPAWPIMLEGLTQPLQDSDALQHLLRAASVLGHTDLAADVAAWIRTQGPPGSVPTRQILLQLTGAHPGVRAAARLVDNLLAPGSAKKRGRPAGPKPPAQAPAGPPPANEDLVEACTQWEREHPVHGWRVNDVHVWPLIRSQLAFRRLAESRGASEFEHGRAHAQTIRQNLRQAGAWMRSFSEQLRSFNQSEVVTLGTSSQRLLRDGRWFNTLLDPLAAALDDMNARSVHLELRQDGHSYRSPQQRPSLKIRPAVWGLMHYAPPAPTWRYEMEGYEAFQQAEGLPQSAQYWQRQVHLLERVADFFVDLFEHMQPKLLIVICHYAWLSRAAVVAARRLGIRTVDLQHGVTSGHPMYEAWTTQPAGGYALLPHKFWSWSGSDADRIEAWGGEAVVGGHPWLNECRRRVSGSKSLPRGRVNVLISLNWSSGFDARMKAAILAAPDDWMFWVRLHPKMPWQREEIVAWCAANAPQTAAVEAATDLPLFAVLDATDIHLTLSSTVTQEAARLGVASVCLDARAKHIYTAEQEAGWMHFEDGGGEEIVTALQAQLTRQNRQAMQPYPEPAAMVATLRQLLD